VRPSARFLPAFPEEWLCRVWERPDLLRQPFRTLDARTVRILDPGTANLGDGPDFLDATIEEDGRPRRGSVEFHFRTSDWYAHRHHTDPRYNGVVLHVVLNHSLPDLYVHTADHGRAPIVELRTHLRIPVGDLANSLASAPKTWDCPLPEDAPAEDVRLQVIDVLGDVRFLRKAEAAGEQRRLLGEDEAAYRMLADALGYANNRETFAQLVELVPLERLRGLEAVDIEALLLGASGFLAIDAPDAHTEHLQRRWNALDGRKETLLREQWRFSRSRHGNTPVRRVVALAGLVSERGSGFVTRFRDMSAQGGADAAWRPRWQSVQVKPTPYWAERLDLGKPSVTKARYLVGETRARDIWVNVVLPMLVATGDAGRGEEMRRRAIDLYHGHPSLQSNYKTRWVAAQALRLPEKADAKQKAKTQQGMLELYDGFCDPRRCFECPIQAARAIPT
jgi:hypothetical protein